MTNTHAIVIDKVKESKIAKTDFDNLTFGKTFTDHMLECTWRDGEWQSVEIKPYGPIEVEPSCKVFHYGQAIFEGMKAFKDATGDVFLFRPEDNWQRFNASAKRLAMPEVPEEIFMEGLKKLVALDKDWVRYGEGLSLYLRPFMISSENGVAAAPSTEYKFMIIMSPAFAYYKGDVRVIIASEFSRAADGGVGYAKAAGNYAASFYPNNLAIQEGYQQVIWTDAASHEYLEEAGTMNIFVRIGDSLFTAPHNDRILNGVTRRSVIQMAKDHGIHVEERRISVNEIREAAKDGSLKEIFGSGTAAVIVPIKGFKHKDFKYELPQLDDSYASRLKEALKDIQYNRAEDKHGWRVKI
ncbi:branched-chain amino acid aminotransferase [Nonlabens dokdonensis]|uniref:Branched-chain-amino-acid aminotransferase n=2 Tax=Nonlabens dokdonensis TaxID=328515 RepID=L7WEC6_NONDD|nr:branched-chain amino acid aminotransferase [Nonlabens dokdonensis]AGC78469.1 branched-chain amino acid aminotransferase/4-amino-4-deoxychorismate lyase [Nonlabens dokdonensis DSW-6]PZX38213.1 branched-chain amino acid aminotransferase [Nonlabens dokdonensis]